MQRKPRAACGAELSKGKLTFAFRMHPTKRSSPLHSLGHGGLHLMRCENLSRLQESSIADLPPEVNI